MTSSRVTMTSPFEFRSTGHPVMEHGAESCVPVTLISQPKWRCVRNFNIQVWLINDKKGVFHRTLQLSFPQNKNSCNVVITGRGRGAGAVYCKWLSDAILPPLSKREFIQEDLVTFQEKNATALSVGTLNHKPREKRWARLVRGQRGPGLPHRDGSHAFGKRGCRWDKPDTDATAIVS